ncbi:hypothetical protein DL96DRAFT_1718917 [Flagelloscypha sp. PMI_526]|nr:hypothetical protein DL96DRAFT_1718917 [Flagelloscypha sp. PMI_526]
MSLGPAYARLYAIPRSIVPVLPSLVSLSSKDHSSNSFTQSSSGPPENPELLPYISGSILLGTSDGAASSDDASLTSHKGRQIHSNPNQSISGDNHNNLDLSHDDGYELHSFADIDIGRWYDNFERRSRELVKPEVDGSSIRGLD